MRRLLYAPIIHDEADIGSAGSALAHESCSIAGVGRWNKHKQRVEKFWRSLGSYLNSFPPSSLRIYQDGLTADGEAGRNIVQEAARRGSKNYQTVLELLTRGAELRKTEDLSLLLQEHQNLLALVGQGQAGGLRLGLEEYRTRRDRLTQARDRFIAGTIEATLEPQELGVLFIGAYHRVADHLSDDIRVEMLKDPKTIQAYVDSLLGGRHDECLEPLGEYLAGPVEGRPLPLL